MTKRNRKDIIFAAIYFHIMNKQLLIIILLIAMVSVTTAQDSNSPYLVVLGTVQDGGYPHPGCDKACCQMFYQGKEKKHYVSSLALIDPITKQRFLFDCTPDFTAQLHNLNAIFPPDSSLFDGIFLTHAHIGHYTGLMYLGKEAMNTKHIVVYLTLDFYEFLDQNGPWSLLQKNDNISLMSLVTGEPFQLNEHITITPFFVPHREEFSKTVGYKISYGSKNIIFIPDIDKWQKWDKDIVQLVKGNDLLFIDGTFYNSNELPGRDMSQIPHPSIEESMTLFKDLSSADKAKIHFIHLNHTNPALIKGSKEQKEVEQNGFHIAQEGEIF